MYVTLKTQQSRDVRTATNPINVFPEKELCGLSFNFHIHVSVSNLYIPKIGSHIFLQQNRQTDCGNIIRSQTHEFRKWD